MEEAKKYMKAAIAQAKRAYRLGEVPIGCVIVYDGKIIGRGYNRRNTDKNTLCHAEITAIRRASKVMGDWRLEDCTMYVTLEPCQMCAGAIVQSRMKEVVIGCMKQGQKLPECDTENLQATLPETEAQQTVDGRQESV